MKLLLLRPLAARLMTFTRSLNDSPKTCPQPAIGGFSGLPCSSKRSNRRRPRFEQVSDRPRLAHQQTAQLRESTAAGRPSSLLYFHSRQAIVRPVILV